MNGEPCMCGATDCPSYGAEQGYRLVRVWDAKLRRYVHRNPEDIEGYDEDADELVDES